MKTGSMTGMEPVLSIVATIISSVALIGVAVGLILQGRQLKANQIQVMREMHLELMRVGINNPIVSASVYEGTSPEDFPKDSLINLSLKFLETGYSLKAITTRLWHCRLPGYSNLNMCALGGQMECVIFSKLRLERSPRKNSLQ